MDPKELDSVLLSFVCLTGFFLSPILNLDHKVCGAKNVFLLSVFSISVIKR